MFARLLGFEINFHARQIGFWITIGIMFLLGFVIMSTDAVTISGSAGERVKANGAITIALLASGFSLFSMFFGAIFVVSGVMRDQVHKMLEIVHATQISTRDMTLSRMGGVYFATFVCLFSIMLGVFAGQFAPWVDQEKLGPVNGLYFLQPALLYIAINTLLISGIFTAVAAITRNRAMVYVSAVGLFLVYTAAGLLAGQDAPDWITSLIDPFGTNALALTVEYWPAAEQNTNMSPLGGLVGVNRLVWGLVGIALYVISFGLFKRGLAAKGGGGDVDAEVDESGSFSLASISPSTGFGANVQAFLARFKFEYLATVRSIPFIILSLMAIVFFGTVVWVNTAFNPDPSIMTSLQMAGMVIGSMLLPLLIIIVFFSGEIIWRDKTAGITEIIDASAVSDGPLLAGKWLSLVAVVMTMLAIGILFGMIAQLVLGGTAINPATYLKLTFVNFAPRVVLYALLVLFIQNFLPNRVIGMLSAGGLVIFFFIIINFLPFSHPLMEYGTLRTGSLSEINGYADLTDFKWFGLYWGSLGALFVVLSTWFWRRGTESGLRKRFVNIGKRMSLLTASLALLFTISFIGTGGWIFKAYNIDNEYLTQKQREKRQVRWEQKFGELYKQELPKIRSVNLELNLYPSKRSGEVRGFYDIENTTSEPISELYVRVSTAHDKDIRELAITGASMLREGEQFDELHEFGYRLFTFATPLAAGAKTKMQFDTWHRPPSLGDETAINHNGTFVNNMVAMPQLGISDRRMRNPDKRRKYELGEFEKRAARENMEARQTHFISNSSDYVDFQARFCTDKGQIPIAPGQLLREYEKDGQTCRDYKSVRPLLNFFSFLSADFEVKRDTWNNPDGEDVALAIYYHRTHDYNLDLMIAAMKSSLDTFTSTFGPYLYKQIRILEFPYASFAQSFAGTIPFSENIGFVMDPGDPEDFKRIDLATYVTMHEIGHQWFAHQIVPANTKGFNVLSEGLTENAALSAYEKELGWKKARYVLEKRAIESYLLSRTTDRDEEPPLALAEGQQYLDYNKASWVFWGLKQTMGEDAMQGAIRGFLEEFGSKGAPYPTTKELVDALRAAAPAKYQGVITDYWDRITFWEFQLNEGIEVTENANGTFAISISMESDKKIASEENGKETSVSEIEGEVLNEWVEIGFYDQDPKKTLGGDWLHLEQVNIKDKNNSFTFQVDKKPTHIMIDPRRLLMERNVDDNVRKTAK